MTSASRRSLCREERSGGASSRFSWCIERNEWLLLKGSDLYSRNQEDRPYPFAIELKRARRSGLPRKLEPMGAAERVRPFSDPGWVFEMEFEGIRVFALKRGASLVLRRSSTGETLEARLKDVRRAILAVRAENVVGVTCRISLHVSHAPKPPRPLL